MFFPVISKEGKKAYLNLGQIFAFVEDGAFTIAINNFGTSFQIAEKLDKLMEEIELSEDGEDGE